LYRNDFQLLVLEKPCVRFAEVLSRAWRESLDAKLLVVEDGLVLVHCLLRWPVIIIFERREFTHLLPIHFGSVKSVGSQVIVILKINHALAILVVLASSAIARYNITVSACAIRWVVNLGPLFY
jgi:hypothetical protein